MRPRAVSYLLTLLIYARLATVASSYSDKACCNRAREKNAFVSPNNGIATLMDNIVCGQSYNESYSAAPDAYVTYNFCKSECSGWGISSTDNLDQWAGSIVQFLLPSVIFSMNIPRRFEFISSRWLEDLVLRNQHGWKRAVLSLLMTIPALLFVTADAIIWVMAIMSMAGPMMVAGLHEALLDFKILKALERRTYIPGRVGGEPNVPSEIALGPLGENVARNNVAGEIMPNDQGIGALRDKVELLVTVLAGNLQLEPYRGNLIVLISDALLATRRRRSTAATPPRPQTPPDFLAPEGPEVEEAQGDRVQMLAWNEANQNYPSMAEKLKRLMTAQSAFGAIVGAAIVFYLGAFLYTILDLLNDKSNQDAAISLAFGPVFMWRRGVNKREWLEEAGAWQRGNQAFMDDVRVKKREYLGWIILPTIILISLPPAAGAVVAWQTPPAGWGCRSLSFVTYAGFQIVLTPLYFIATRRTVPRTMSQRVIRWLWVLVFSLTLLLALFTSIATTLMQIIGVFRNCFCYVNTDMWLNLDNAIVNVASDTKNRRSASDGWIVMGGVATVFMAICSFFGWWFQMNIRATFEDAIRDIDKSF
ncbi:uncharacterized protein BKA55DRAFT_668986 [Fusarium redolens]|uniref:Uncharacterized protein n=1 Tax=Fusarium redolens TaxID=48865 RepID=A0A9P9JNU7_FUSRE|nr:uncharacterized protein BKA55DRAFT_668986 [Fusarium redolens]KAH7202863.1 hypothetical protein BKA55DRAFT_668986 [Fusarium redolens]